MRISDWSSDLCSSDLSTNRNKRSVALDISRPEGREVLLRLLQGADVFIENFKVGDMARYGLAWDDLKERFPRLVYASVTGFGQTGPYAKRAGYDSLAQGMGGVMSVTGEAERSEEHTAEIQSLMRSSYAAICLKNKKHNPPPLNQLTC